MRLTEVPCHWAKLSVSTLLILSKHLPAFPAISLIFLFIVPGLSYPKIGDSASFSNTLETDKQTNRQSCGQPAAMADMKLEDPFPSLCHEGPRMRDELSHWGEERTSPLDERSTALAIYDPCIWNYPCWRIHAYIHLLPAPRIAEVCWSLSLVCHRPKQDDTLDKWLVHCRTIRKDKQPVTLNNLTFGFWEEAGESVGTYTDTGMHTAHKKTPGQE